MILGGVVTFAPLSAGFAYGSPNYGLSWNVVAGGGGTSLSPHYVLSGTNGQGMPGVSASGHYRLGSGFWYGFGLPAAAEHKLYMPTILK